MDADHARALVDQIRSAVTVAVDAITEAWQGRAWEVLGYASWDALCESEFGVRLQLPQAERMAVVGTMTADGMSTRAIGTALGVDKDTIREDRLRGGNPPPAQVIGLDGKRYPPTVTPSGLPVPAGDDPHAYESDCHTDPSGGVRQLHDLLRAWDRYLRNYYATPSGSQLDVIAGWLDKHQRSITRARRNLP